MTRDEFKKIVAAMKVVYTFENFIADGEAFNVWYSLLSDLPYSEVSLAVQKFMQTSTKVPTIADIRNLCVPEVEVFENDAWVIVRKAIGRANYYADEDFDKFPPLVQKAVGSPSQLRIWGADEHFNEGVESSNFKRIYRQLAEREHINRTYSENVRIADNNKRLEIEGKDV